MKVETHCIDLRVSNDIPSGSLDSVNTVVFVYTVSKLSIARPLMEKVAFAYPKSIIVACSTNGEILDDNIYDDHAVLAICKFEKSTVKSVQVNVNDEISPYQAGKFIAEQLKTDDLKGIYLIYDGGMINGSKVAKGLVKILGKDGVPVIGGASGALNINSEYSWVYSEGRCEKGAIVAVGFYGDDLQFGWGSNDGWMAHGKDYKVTRSIDNLVLELDKRPALEVYKEAMDMVDYTDDQVRAICNRTPFAILSGSSNSNRIIRSIFSVRTAQKSLVSTGDIHEGATIQLMKSTPERLIKGAERSAMRARLNASEVGLVLLTSCGGRRLVLGDDAEKELEIVKSHFPEETKIAGFYSWGELSPCMDGSACAMQNQTMTIAFLKEWM